MLGQVRKSKMYRKLRKVKSEVPTRVVKIERSKTPLRYSRRLRQLPPEYMEYYDAIRDTLKQGKQVISQESWVLVGAIGAGYKLLWLFQVSAVYEQTEETALSAEGWQFQGIGQYT